MIRLVRINTEEFQLVLAMNRLRHAYLKMAPGLEPSAAFDGADP